MSGRNNRVKGLVQNNKGINAEQETGNLEPEMGFRGGKCCPVGEGVGDILG